MASKMSSNSANSANGSNSAPHGAIPKDPPPPVASVSISDTGQSYEPPDIDPVTLKRNPKLELSKGDLLKLLSCLEGELQARDVVIATLKNEKVKHMLCQARYGKLSFTDPVMALQRDSSQAKHQTVDEALIRSMADHQMASLENLILAQRSAQLKMAQYLRDAEERHAKAVQELEDEKAKHAHDTAQGDDVTYALERERTRLKQELDTERQAKKKLEKDLKRVSDTLEEERSRQKHMVLLLLAERKKIVTKYIEERKRSEDLAQILSEEKGRAANMAEGLEEESKRSLQMEADLERHLATCADDKLQLSSALAAEQKRYQELFGEHERLQRECDRLKNQLSEAHQVAMFQANSMAGRYGSGGPTSPRPGGPGPLPPTPPGKPSLTTAGAGAPPPGGSTGAAAARSAAASPGGSLTAPKLSGRRAVSPAAAVGGAGPAAAAAAAGTGAGGGAGEDMTAMAANITKAVQPTATVSSQPVSAPLTGVAYGVQPGVALRGVQYGTAPAGPAAAAPLQTSVGPVADARPPGPAQLVRVTPRVSVTASPGTKVLTSSQPGKVMFHVTTPAAAAGGVGGAVPAAAAVASGAPSVGRKPPLGRGVPPPVPPNKPAVPPNKPTTAAAAAAKCATVAPSGARAELPAGQVGGGAATVAPLAATAAGQQGDALGPELANFQQMLVSMAELTGRRRGAHQ